MLVSLVPMTDTGDVKARAETKELVMSAAIGEAGAELLTSGFFKTRPNQHTHACYERAVSRFCKWCEDQKLPLRALDARSIVAYFDHLQESLASGTIRVHAAFGVGSAGQCTVSGGSCNSGGVAMRGIIDLLGLRFDRLGREQGAALTCAGLPGRISIDSLFVIAHVPGEHPQ
jgi:hypothetical protein